MLGLCSRTGCPIHHMSGLWWSVSELPYVDEMGKLTWPLAFVGNSKE
jgi:hypothetical protein